MTHPDRYDDTSPARRAAEVVFVRHAQVYVLVNAFLVVIWAVTDFGGYFWPIWPILGWGLAVALQGAATFGGRGRD
jgi:hypothetical protein